MPAGGAPNETAGLAPLLALLDAPRPNSAAVGRLAASRSPIVRRAPALGVGPGDTLLSATTERQ